MINANEEKEDKFYIIMSLEKIVFYLFIFNIVYIYVPNRF